MGEAHSLTVNALVASKTLKANAESVAEALIAAEASGQSGHGLSRVPGYAAQASVGKVDGFAEPAIERTRPGVLSVDAGFGFAYPAFDLALKHLPEVTFEQGIASVGIYRSHHFGQAGLHCEKLAERGLCAFVYGNAPKSIAPWGGTKPLVGTNPIAFAAPMPEGPPLVIDLAISRVARGKVMAAHNLGKDIPEGWALNKEGQPTTNAKDALEGTMIPIGEAKGAALALMVEVMSACLTASNLGIQASSLFSAEGPPPNLGQSILTLDPKAFAGSGFFERMGLLAQAYEDEGVRMPGTRRLVSREKAAAGGVEVEEALLAEIRRLAGA